MALSEEPDGVEAVFFDLDDTVWEYNRTSEDLLAVAFDEVGVEPCFTAAEYDACMSHHLDDVDDVADLRRCCFSDLAADAGHDPEVGVHLADVYTRERDHRDVRLLPGAREALDALAENYLVAAITNGARVAQTAKMDELGLDSAFERIVYAGEDTLAKPDPEPFEVALDALGVAAERAVHVGNSLANDVVGATEAGICSVWIPCEADVETNGHEPTYRLGSIDALRTPPWE